MSKKRSRGPNWGDAEKTLLKELVDEEIIIIECKITDTNTNIEKRKAWERIHGLFCELSERERSLPELKQQWRCLKRHEKESQEHEQSTPKTAGEPKVTNPHEEVTEFLELIPLKFDDNGPSTNEFPSKSLLSIREEEEVAETLSSTSTARLLHEKNERKRKVSNCDDDYKKTLIRLAEKRSEEMLKQQEAEHKKRMLIMELEMKMKIQEHDERVRILKEQADKKAKISDLKIEILRLQKLNNILKQ